MAINPNVFACPVADLPVRAGAFKPGPDGHLAAGLDHGGGRAEPLRTERRVAHAAAIRPEVADAHADLVALGGVAARAVLPGQGGQDLEGRREVFADEVPDPGGPIARDDWPARDGTGGHGHGPTARRRLHRPRGDALAVGAALLRAAVQVIGALRAERAVLAACGEGLRVDGAPAHARDDPHPMQEAEALGLVVS